MTGTAAPTVHLLTYRPEQMLTWWAALLGVPDPPRGRGRTAVLCSPTINIVIERSDVAVDYHREACGVTTIAVTPAGPADAVTTIDRLARLGSSPHRATVHAGFIRLWYRDPNGADVAVDLRSVDPVDGPYDPLFPDELDPQVVVAGLRMQCVR